MNINFAFRGFDSHSDGLKDYASKRLQKLEKLIHRNSIVDVVFNKGKNETDKETEIKVNLHGDNFIAKTSETEFNAGIDGCVDKLTRQIVRKKQKIQDSNRRK